MKKIFTLISVALAAMGANAQENNTFRWSVPIDFDMTEYHKVIEATDEQGNLMGTVEMLSSPNKNDLFNELKDENGDRVLGEDGKPMFDESKPKEAWSWKCNDPANNMSLSVWEGGFDYGIIGKGNPVMSQDEGWVETDNGWSYRVENAVYWTPGCGELPKQGEYIKVTPTADGNITVGLFINKGGGDSGHGHRLYIIDQSTAAQGYQVLSPAEITVRGSFQNNTWVPSEKKIQQDENGNWVEVTDENGESVYWYPWGDDPTLPMNIIMSENYSVFEYVNQKGESTYFNRPFLGFVSFNVKKDVTYWMLNPTSQLGFYGFELNTEVDGIAENLTAAPADYQQAYSLSGQKVQPSFKGIIVKNGKKYINR